MNICRYSFGIHKHLFLLDISLWVGLLGHKVNICLALVGIAKQYFKVVE